MNATVNTYSWLIRRELWERRTIWLVPAVIGGIVILLAMFGRFHFLAEDAPAPAWSLLPYLLSLIFYLVAVGVATLYFLDCLYEDRRDRSILFWKSLPISDTDAVLSKLLTGVLVIPLVSFIAADVAALIAAIVITVRENAAVAHQLWQFRSWWNLQVLWLYIIATAAIWYLPLIGWLMLVSSWAKRAPLLWAILPFMVDSLLEHFFLGTHLLDRFIERWVGGYLPAAMNGEHIHVSDAYAVPGALYQMLNPIGFLTNPGTWIGAVVGVALIVATIQVRMRRTES